MESLLSTLNPNLAVFTLRGPKYNIVFVAKWRKVTDTKGIALHSILQT